MSGVTPEVPAYVGPWSHLCPAVQKRLDLILRIFLPDVFEVQLITEEISGFTSVIGQNNLADALSHMTTLATDTSLDEEQQATQCAKIEEHLKRVMIEHPEEVTRDRMGVIRDRWLEYERTCYPLRSSGGLVDAPGHEHMNQLRNGIETLLVNARKRKADEATWDDAKKAAAYSSKAAKDAIELADSLERCIGMAAKEKRESNQQRNLVLRWGVTLLVTIAIGVGGYVIGSQVEDTASKGEPNQPRVSSPKP